MLGSMATVEAARQLLYGGIGCLGCFDPFLSNVNGVISVKSGVNVARKRSSVRAQVHKCSRVQQDRRGVGPFQGTSGASHRLESMRYNCQRVESLSGGTAEDQRRTLFVDESDKVKSVPHNGMPISDVNEFKVDQPLDHGNGGFGSNGKPAAAAINEDSSKKIEDEAWTLLRNSMVYYCNNPIGTIAANDPSSPGTLNYDQVFIRDFVPSGIAFLLKGEYDIVRNFILHTLQLQVYLSIPIDLYLLDSSSDFGICILVPCSKFLPLFS